MTPESASPSPERAQVERLLADPLFSQSKRYGQFLRYVTERALGNSHGPLSERALGVEIFGRPHNYDTDADPIVRVTASELRKRLSQYYEDPAHANEIRVVIHKGTYAAEFLPPGTPAKTPEEATPASAPPTTRPEKTAARWRWVVAAGLVCAIGAAAVWLWIARWRQNALGALWAPLGDGREPILVAVPQISDHVAFAGGENPKLVWSDALTPTPDHMFIDWAQYSRGLVHFRDLSVACKIAEYLGSRGWRGEVKGEHDLNMRDLRESPAVILGGLTNQWTMRLTEQTRFSFGGEGTTRFIRDRQNPSARQWQFDAKVPSGRRDKDYIIISRITDSLTGRPLLLAGGFSAWGTEAAVELLTDPARMAAVVKGARGDWSARNLQLVFECAVVNLQAGTPKLLVTHTW